MPFIYFFVLLSVIYPHYNAVLASDTCSPEDLRACVSRVQQAFNLCAESDLSCMCTSARDVGVLCYKDCPKTTLVDFLETFTNDQCRHADVFATNAVRFTGDSNFQHRDNGHPYSFAENDDDFTRFFENDDDDMMYYENPSTGDDLYDGSGDLPDYHAHYDSPAPRYADSHPSTDYLYDGSGDLPDYHAHYDSPVPRYADSHPSTDYLYDGSSDLPDYRAHYDSPVPRYADSHPSTDYMYDPDNEFMRVPPLRNGYTDDWYDPQDDEYDNHPYDLQYLYGPDYPPMNGQYAPVYRNRPHDYDDFSTVGNAIRYRGPAGQMPRQYYTSPRPRYDNDMDDDSEDDDESGNDDAKTSRLRDRLLKHLNWVSRNAGNDDRVELLKTVNPEGERAHVAQKHEFDEDVENVEDIEDVENNASSTDDDENVENNVNATDDDDDDGETHKTSTSYEGLIGLEGEQEEHRESVEHDEQAEHEDENTDANEFLDSEEITGDSPTEEYKDDDQDSTAEEYQPDQESVEEYNEALEAPSDEHDEHDDQNSQEQYDNEVLEVPLNEDQNNQNDQDENDSHHNDEFFDEFSHYYDQYNINVASSTVVSSESSSDVLTSPLDMSIKASAVKQMIITPASLAPAITPPPDPAVIEQSMRDERESSEIIRMKSQLSSERRRKAEESARLELERSPSTKQKSTSSKTEEIVVDIPSVGFHKEDHRFSSSSSKVGLLLPLILAPGAALLWYLNAQTLVVGAYAASLAAYFSYGLYC